MVYSEFLNWNDPTDARYRDFALIEIDVDRYPLVDPSVRHWGGPVGIAQVFPTDSPIVTYGQAAYLSALEPGRARGGVLHGVYGDESNENGARFNGWFSATYPTAGGDSGGVLLMADGRAMGSPNWVAPARGEGGLVLGPTFQSVLADLKEAGFEVSVVTAPFHGGDPAALATQTVEMVRHCADDPGVGGATSNACVREPLP